MLCRFVPIYICPTYRKIKDTTSQVSLSRFRCKLTYVAHFHASVSKAVFPTFYFKNNNV